MDVYTSRTHGSYIEETEMKVLWQYRDADPEFGYLQAKELEDHLSNVLRNYTVDILHGGVEEGGYVEVRPKGVNKGVAAIHILKSLPKISTWQKIDFTVILGDDHCDEPMLSVMRQVGRRAIDARRAKKGDLPLPPLPATVTIVDVSSCDDLISPSLETFTCTVGKKPSAAANYLHDVDEVQEFLDSLVKVSTQDHKFHSSVDLRVLDNVGATPYRFSRADDHDISPRTMQMNISNNNQTISSGVTRSMSMGTFHHSFSKESKVAPVQKVSTNLNEFLGTIEDASDGAEDEDGFFF